MKINPNLVDIYKKDTIKISKLQEEYIKWYDSLQTRYPLSYYLTNQDIAYLYRCAMSPALNCNVKEKYHLIGELMRNRGFELIGGGTNRRAYRCTFEDLVIKIATDQVGFTSNLREYPNQNVIKPFCTKIFGTDYNGVVSMSEQFIPFKTVEEFQKYSQDIFDILYFKLRNNDIGMEDVGTRSFKNWGLRNGFGPGMLDFPTMYVLDPTKRFCRNIVNGQMCGGTLDYDDGFNVIVCSECGRTHFSRTLAKKDGEDISKLLQAVGYQQRKNEKESFSMKIKLVNLETGEVESVREVGGKSNFVDPNRRRKPKQVINLNEPQNNSKKKKEIKFKDVIVGTLNPETGEIEDGTTLKVKPEFIFDKPVMTTEKKPYISSYFIAEDELEELVNKDKKHSVEEVINTFDKLIVDTTMNYEGNNDPNNVMDIIDVINNNINGTTHIPREKADSMFKELSVATLDIDTLISDNTIMTFNNTMIARLVQRIIRNPEDNFTAFYHLINTVKNSASFFESVIGFFKTVLEHFSYDIDEKVKDEDFHYMYRDVFNVARKAIAYVFDDFLYNIMLNGVSNSFSGQLVYNRNNAFVKLRDCLKEMSEIFNNAEKASVSTDKTAHIQLYRSNDYAEIRCFFIKEYDNDNETELDTSDDTEENSIDSSEDNEDISEEISTEDIETDEEDEAERKTASEEEISNVAEEEETEEKVSEKDADGTVENNMDNISNHESSDDTSYSDDESVIPVRNKVKHTPTNTDGMINSYNKMSRKQRRKFEKGGKKKHK